MHSFYFNKLIMCQYSHGILFTVVIPLTVLLFLFVVEDIVQDTTIQINSSWRFLNPVHLCKKYFSHIIALVAPTI